MATRVKVIVEIADKESYLLIEYPVIINLQYKDTQVESNITFRLEVSQQLVNLLQINDHRQCFGRWLRSTLTIKQSLPV